MRKNWIAFSALAALAAAQLTTPAVLGGVGDKASSVEPSEWINNKGPVSWSNLKGRLILVEKWATW